MRRSNFSAVALTLLPFAVLTAPLAAAQDRSAEQISEDIAFARGLASSWQFLDLAEGVLDGLQGQALAGSQREELSLARSEVYASGARTTGDDSAREALFDQALDGYRSFLDSYPASALLSRARRDYVGVASDYATHMSNLLDSAASADATRIRSAVESRISAVLSDAAEAIADLENVPDRTDAQERLYWSLRIDRGRLLLRLGRASRDGTGYLRLAEDEMGAITFEAPSDSSFPHQAFMVLGEAFLAMGQLVDAADTFAYVAEESIPKNRATWDALKPDLTTPQIQFRWFYLEEVTPSIIETYMLAGKSQLAADAGLHLLNIHNLENLEYSPRGDLAVVATARCLFESGGVIGGTVSGGNYRWFQTADEAEAAGFNSRTQRAALETSLQLALEMSERGRGFAADRAKALIADLIESPGLTFGPQVLFQAARGAFDARDYTAAASAFKRVWLAVANDPVEAPLWGGKVNWFIGECYRKQGRDLEAAMAYRNGILRFKGDLDYASANATSAYAAIGRAMKVDSSSRVFVELRDELATIVASVNPGEDIFYERGLRAFNAATEEKNEQIARSGFAEAARDFAEVPADSSNYGAARARIGLSRYRAGDLAGAEEAYTAFDEELASTKDKTVRGQLEANFKLVRFYQGSLAKDRGDWARALDIFGQYPTQFPDEADKHDVALANAVQAAVKLGQTSRALEIVRRMASDFPESEQTLRAAAEVFTPLYEIYKETQSGDPDRTAVLGALAEVTVLRNRLTSSPTFSLLRLESRLHIEREQWETALATLERIAKVFGDDTSEEMQKDLKNYVQPDRGITLINLDRLPEAHAILAPLVPDPNDDAASRPSSDVVDGYVKSVAGWTKGDPTKPTVMAGVGGATELEKAYVWATKLTKGVEGRNQPGKYSAPWFKAKYLELWVLYQWGKLDSSKMDSLKQIFVSFRRDYDADYGRLLKDPVNADAKLAAQYRWLDRAASN